jgi:hypothetical protein
MLRRPVIAWLTWLTLSYGLMGAAAWTSPAPWEIGAYTRALDIMSPHTWSVFWFSIAAFAIWALICRCVWVARAALVASVAVQLPWAVSVAWEGVALGEPWAYVPAALVWLTPAAGSAAKLTQSLVVPDWPTVGG